MNSKLASNYRVAIPADCRGKRAALTRVRIGLLRGSVEPKITGEQFASGTPDAEELRLRFSGVEIAAARKNLVCLCREASKNKPTRRKTTERKQKRVESVRARAEEER